MWGGRSPLRCRARGLLLMFASGPGRCTETWACARAAIRCAGGYRRAGRRRVWMRTGRCANWKSPRTGFWDAQSPLAKEMDVVLDASVLREADPGGFTPTASVAAALAMGHALAVALMEARGFSAEHFSRFHAGGQLGRSLRLRVADVMHVAGEVAWVAPGDSMKRVVVEMSRHPLGAACVVSPEQELLGLITDGDVGAPLENAGQCSGKAGCGLDYDAVAGAGGGGDAGSRCAAGDGGSAVADLGAAGGGRGAVPGVGADSRFVSALRWAAQTSRAHRLRGRAGLDRQQSAFGFLCYAFLCRLGVSACTGRNSGVITSCPAALISE